MPSNLSQREQRPLTVGQNHVGAGTLYRPRHLGSGIASVAFHAYFRHHPNSEPAAVARATPGSPASATPRSLVRNHYRRRLPDDKPESSGFPNRPLQLHGGAR